ETSSKKLMEILIDREIVMEQETFELNGKRKVQGYYIYKKKQQEQSLKLAQYYTPECLVDLCLELLQPKGELFDPCCGLGSFLLKAKSRDETLQISGNDIATDLGELPFTFSHGDYLKTETQAHDYTIANIPFNSKKTHCQLIIKNTRKKALIILPSGVNGGLNPTITKKRIEIINSGVIELVCQLPSHLFNQTGQKDLALEKNKEEEKNEFDYSLHVGFFDGISQNEPEKTEEEVQSLAKEVRKIYEEINHSEINELLKKLEKNGKINQQLIKYTYELRYSLHALIADAYHKLMMLEEMDDSGEIQLQSCFVEGQRITELQNKIRDLLLELPKTLFLPLGDLLFEKYKDSQIKIKDHFKLVRGKTPPTKNPEYYEKGTIKWINSGVLTNLYFLTEYTPPSKLVTEKAVQDCKLAYAKPKTVLLANIAPNLKKIV
ncbi:46129_t:CDS:2, partial [Gigaspora margarita]